MGPTILAGTENGLHVLSDARRVELEGRAIGAIAAGPQGLLVVAGGTEILASERREDDWRLLASLSSREARCLLPVADGLLIGTTEAHLLRLSAGGLETVQGFERVAGRDDWFTPWGGPPATRSLSEGAAGELFANVHVGGIPRSRDGGASWQPTIEIEVDAHEVRSPADHPGLVLAATAHGLATSRDSGVTWTRTAEGLQATYARAAALAGDVVLMTASDGPRGGHAAVYRRALDSIGPFERCTEGLPEWFEDNIDTACLQAAGSHVVFGTASGEVHASEDAGSSWQRVADGLSPVRCLLLASER
jgi:hypothetical protein